MTIGELPIGSLVRLSCKCVVAIGDMVNTDFGPYVMIDRVATYGTKCHEHRRNDTHATKLWIGHHVRRTGDAVADMLDCDIWTTGVIDQFIVFTDNEKN